MRVHGRSVDLAIQDVVAELAFTRMQPATDIEARLASAQRPKEGAIARIVGIFALLIGETTVFAELERNLNRIWKITPIKKHRRPISFYLGNSDCPFDHAGSTRAAGSFCAERQAAPPMSGLYALGEPFARPAATARTLLVVRHRMVRHHYQPSTLLEVRKCLPSLRF